MTKSLSVAVVQLNSGEDKAANLASATEWIERAAGEGADLVALPEMFNCLGKFSTVVAGAEPIPGPTSTAMQQLAKRLGVTLLAGSICEQSPARGKAYNTSLLFSADGEQLARYRKMHLFDIDLPGQVSITESHWIIPGDHIETADVRGTKAGLSICYDLRFPELFRRFSDVGVELIFAPAAFTEATGRDHWEILLRARAIENQSIVIAPNQCGEHGSELTTYGNSMIVDAWGNVLARADKVPGFVLADIDLNQLRESRVQLPALLHRRVL